MTSNPTVPPPLAPTIGTAERGLSTLLAPKLERAGITFPQWTVFVLLNAGGPLTRGELVRRQVGGHVVADVATSEEVIDGLRSSGLVGPAAAHGSDTAGSDPLLTMTSSGEALFRPLWRQASATAEKIFGDLPAADVAATRRVLTEVARRVNALLAEAA